MTVEYRINAIWPDCKVEILPNDFIKVIRPNGKVETSYGPLGRYIKWSIINIHKQKITE